MSVRPSLARGLALGGDYNPEQWPRKFWAEDVRLMSEAGVDLVRRRVDATSYLFVLNHTAGTATIPTNGVDLLTGNAVTGKLELAAGDVAVLREEGG